MVVRDGAEPDHSLFSFVPLATVGPFCDQRRCSPKRRRGYNSGLADLLCSDAHGAPFWPCSMVTPISPSIRAKSHAKWMPASAPFNVGLGASQESASSSGTQLVIRFCIGRNSKVEAVSTDLRFGAAVNAALSVATTALAASGRRSVTQAGHHVKTIESLELTRL
jgi:hypothetical protein